MSRKPWTSEELAALCSIKPYDHGAVIRHAKVYGRGPLAVYAKLSVLRTRQQVQDVSFTRVSGRNGHVQG